jgi:hypothetical protein
LSLKLKKIYFKYISENLGLINLFGKSFGRVLYLILISYLSYKLSVEDFAKFAIFWSSLRMFTFYGTNNLNIIYFNEVRRHLMEEKVWSAKISANIVFNSVFFCLITFVLSFLIFDGLGTTLILVVCLLCSIIIRNISEFAKADNNLFLSIVIDDILFYVLFFVFTVVGLMFTIDLDMVLYGLLLASFITAISALVLFGRKFQIEISSYRIYLHHFSFTDFKLGLNYTFLRGNEVLSNFAVRYLGQIYFGDLFVAYAHIMYQFYNIFALLTVSVVSGFQSKVTVKTDNQFNKAFFNLSYKKIQKTVLPFVSLLLLGLIFTSDTILLFLFPKYISFSTLLIKVGFAGMVFAIIQPFVFILVYNNRFTNIVKLNITQYLVMILLFTLPLLLPDFNQQVWFLLVMASLLLVQGVFAWLNYKRIK